VSRRAVAVAILFLFAGIAAAWWAPVAAPSLSASIADTRAHANNLRQFRLDRARPSYCRREQEGRAEWMILRRLPARPARQELRRFGRRARDGTDRPELILAVMTGDIQAGA